MIFPFFFFVLFFCFFLRFSWLKLFGGVCVCVWERERERERDRFNYSLKDFKHGPLLDFCQIILRSVILVLASMDWSFLIQFEVLLLLDYVWFFCSIRTWTFSFYVMRHWREMLVAQLCLILCDPMDCNTPGSSIHGILQAKYWSG